MGVKKKVMEIQELKSKIENKDLNDNLLIFQNGLNNYISKQYIKTISEFKNLEINYINNLDELISAQSNPFYINDYLFVYECSNFDRDDPALKNLFNTIIITDKIKINQLLANFNDYIVDIPTLQNWQIEAFVQNKLPKLNKEEISWLLESCKYDLFKLENEIKKLELIPTQGAFTQFKYNGQFNHLTTYSIFDLSTAIIKKDIPKINLILKELPTIDPFALLSLLYSNFKNIINIQLDSKATAESLGMNPKQFVAIKYNIGHYNKEQLIKIFKFLTSLDSKIKSGELDSTIATDYMISTIINS